MECNNNQLINITKMKLTDKNGAVYCSPKVVEITMNPEGVLCSSFENLNNEFDYTWEEE